MKRKITYGNNRSSIEVDCYPSYCGICHKSVDPIFIGSTLNNITFIPSKFQAAFQCTNTECNSVIIGHFERKGGINDYNLTDSTPIKPEEKIFNNEITKVSPNFVEIYNQSYFAEQNDLKLISGIGYRKALEFLVKDYLIYLTPDEKEKFLKKPLGQCIEMIDNENIKEISKRAVWIGNDEAHYIRKWEDKDVEDLKSMIEITVYFISMDVSSRAYLEEMP